MLVPPQPWGPNLDITSLLIFAGALLVAAGSPGPSIAALVARVMTAGWRGVPFRPRNSARSAVHSSCWPLRSAKATRSANTGFHRFQAVRARVSTSTAVTTVGALFSRCTPRTHST